MWNETSFRRDYLDLMGEYLNMPTQPTLFVCIPPPLYTTRAAFGIQPHIVNQVLPVIVPEVARAAAARSEKFANKVHLIDNFRRFGGGVVHANFTPAYQVNPNETMGRWPNDYVHLSDVGYAAMAEHVYQSLVVHINALK
jgi:lysophospholipase L1-like esterase